jgi:hypothetical protein
MPDFTIEVQAVGGAEAPEIATTSQAVEISVSPAVVFEGGAGGSDKYYVHIQNDAANPWEYEHGMGKNPAVRTFGMDGVEREGDVSYPENNVSVRIDWSGLQSGYAFNN